MRAFLFLLVTTLLCALVAAGDVVVLTEENFASVIDDAELAIVKFYAPWCGHCKRMAEDYEQAAAALLGKAVLAEVDATVESNLAEDFEVRGYPTLKVFKNGEMFTEYSGPRERDAFIKFVERALTPATAELSEETAASQFMQGEGLRVTGQFSDEESAKAFRDLASEMREEMEDAYFAVCSGDATSACGTTANSIAVHVHGEEPRHLTSEDASLVDVDELRSFLRKASIPLVGEINQVTFRSYFEADVPIVVAFLDPEDAAVVDKVVSQMREIAPEFKGKVHFVTADGVQLARQMGNLGLSGNLPAVAIDTLRTKVHFPMDESTEITSDNLRSFVSSYVSGELKWTPRSEEAVDNTDAPVSVVVGSNFEDIVYDDSKDVLVKIYAPWCGHCKALAPVWEELGESYANDPNVVIAKMDATVNDPPLEVEYQGFPTLRWFPAGSADRAGMDYMGGRELEDFRAFIEENRATSVSKATSGGEKEEL